MLKSCSSRLSRPRYNRPRASLGWVGHRRSAALALPPGETVVCTEKDAAKLWQHQPQALAVPLVLTPEVAFWQALDEQVNRHNVTWKWVRGHIGHHGNERADQLANRGVDEVRGYKQS